GRAAAQEARRRRHRHAAGLRLLHGRDRAVTRRSLRLRLALAGAASIIAALVAAFFVLSTLFERHVERRIAAELVLHLNQVIAGLAEQPGTSLHLVKPPVDPRFDRPLSGLYW